MGDMTGADRAIETTARGIVERSRDGAAAVVTAWTDPGAFRAWHEEQKQELMWRWPVLAYAIERLVAERAPHPPGPTRHFREDNDDDGGS